jgi:hypothetical protein
MATKSKSTIRREKLIARGLCFSCGKRNIDKRSTSRCRECIDLCVVKHKARLAADPIFRTKYYESNKKRYELIRDKILDHYGRRCSCCGETESRFLEVDHVNNDGKEHRKIVRTNNLYRWLIKNNFPEGFQILCSNCNKAKGICGICPHQQKREQSSLS